MSASGTRLTSPERRVAVLDAAKKEFAAKGFAGTSTEDIARTAGISQPYLFRLFKSKKELYLATAQRSIDELYEVFSHAAEGKAGVEALQAMGEAYKEVMQDRDRLMLMLKCWASSDDPDIRSLSRTAWRNLVELAEQASGASPALVSEFFARGTLITILMSMELLDDPEPWADRLLAALQEGLEA